MKGREGDELVGLEVYFFFLFGSVFIVILLFFSLFYIQVSQCFVEYYLVFGCCDGCWVYGNIYFFSIY